jgi:pimeloyl-ACP methyl ester carboxylesterase
VAGGDTRFFVRALGHGDDVALLLHGWPETGDCWRQVAPMLAAEGWRVVCPDLKGCGRSSTPGSGYDTRTLADEMSRLIRNLHVRKAVIVGHDWGGAVALATALRHPGRVRALVLSNSPYRRLDPIRAWHVPLFNLPVLPGLANRMRPETLVRLAIARAAVVREGFTDEVISAYADGLASSNGDWLNYYRTIPRRAALGAAARFARRLVPLAGDAGHRPPLRVPARLVWGELDPVLPPSIADRAAADLGADVVRIPGVGHFPHEEDPLSFSRAILDFIGAAVPTRQ